MCIQSLQLNHKSSVSMEDCHLQSIPLTISEPWIVYKRFPTKDPCVICSGLIQMIVVDGAYLLVELDTLSAKTSPTLSITPMVSLLSLELTSSSWKDTIGVMIDKLSPSSPLPTTAIVVAIKLLSWNWMITSNTPSYNSTLLLDEENPMSREGLLTTSCSYWSWFDQHFHPDFFKEGERKS